MAVLSVIIPVFNAADTLRDCVRSVMEQSFGDLEAILVDDGSTDGSSSLCDELGRLDPRIRVVHRPNGGSSAARNSGLAVAAGELVAFMDADDLLPDGDVYRCLVDVLRQDDLEIVCGDVVARDWLSGRERPYGPLCAFAPEGVVVDGAALGDMALDALFNVSVCNKIFRRDLLNGLSFEPGVKFEDVGFWVEALFRARRLGCVARPAYVYRINRPGSNVTVRDYRDYPLAWERQLCALRAQGLFSSGTAGAFIVHVGLKFIQAYNLSASDARRALFLRAKAFFLSCGPLFRSPRHALPIDLAVRFHICCCRGLSPLFYRLLFWPEVILRCGWLNRLLRCRF